MSVAVIESTDQFNDLINDKYVIIDYNAEWCKPCSRIAPILNKFALHYNVNVLKVNVDDHESLGNKYKIKSLPTLTLMKNGKELVDYRIVGADLHKIDMLFNKTSKLLKY